MRPQSGTTGVILALALTFFGHPSARDTVLLCVVMFGCLFYAGSGWVTKPSLSAVEKMGHTLFLTVACASLVCLYGWYFWPAREFVPSVENADNPFESVFRVTLRSGPELSEFQLYCAVMDIEWVKQQRSVKKVPAYYIRPFSNVLNPGDTVGDRCLEGITSNSDGGPDCLDVVFGISTPDGNGPTIFSSRFVAWKVMGFKWQGQPVNGPQGRSYCDYGVP